MEYPITTITNEKHGKRKLPSQFEEQVRPDLIKRAVVTIQKNNRQAYGAQPEAGQRQSAKLSRRRRDYKTSYGIGISRVPRKIMSRRGTRMNWVGAVAPGTVGGRRAHPPKSSKIIQVKINNKERKKAIRSCLAATALRKDWPLIIEKKAEEIKTTKELKQMLDKLGLHLRDEKKVRAGKGTKRGRRYKKSRGMLIVVSKECSLEKAGRNLAGIEIREAKKLDAETLAPGCQVRPTIYTEESLDVIEKEKLFT
ncbi:MAG: 50S ribosomal protein L4 [Candidatus Woesearchaeota archaeon]